MSAAEALKLALAVDCFGSCPRFGALQTSHGIARFVLEKHKCWFVDSKPLDHFLPANCWPKRLIHSRGTSWRSLLAVAVQERVIRSLPSCRQGQASIARIGHWRLCGTGRELGIVHHEIMQQHMLIKAHACLHLSSLWCNNDWAKFVTERRANPYTGPGSAAPKRLDDLHYACSLLCPGTHASISSNR
eukprot:5656362-Amphidinium_carterae.1